MKLCRNPLLFALIAAALVLMSAAWMRGAEYDEQYTLFLTAGVARPDWPVGVFTAGEVRRLQAGHTSFAAIARDLRATDVHPPLYFWTVAEWRTVFGDSLFAARMASVLFNVAALCMVAVIARLAGVPAVMAVLLTAGCYGFVYTGVIARGFALAQLLTLSGVAVLLCAERRASGRIALVAGTLLGAATFSNYLAAFVGCAALLWSARPRNNNIVPLPLREGVGGGGRSFRGGVHPSPYPLPQGEGEDHVSTPAWLCPRLAMAAGLGFAVWLPGELWFFLAQRQSRVGQFAPFDAASGAVQLARYFTANVLGGLPLYVSGLASQFAASALALLLVALTGLTIWQWRAIATPGPRLLLAMGAAATPLGLLLLGIVFNSIPIELRYLAFATPFIGLLLAGALATLPQRAGYTLCTFVLAIQISSLVGMMTRQETMQPARATAVAAVALAGDGVALVPHGNDGVGIVSAFAIEAPPTLPLLVVGKNASPAEIRARVGRFPRVVLALLGQDADSRETLPVMREAFTDPCWRAAGEGFNVLAFDRICREE